MPARRTLLAAFAGAPLAALAGRAARAESSDQPPVPPEDQFVTMANGVRFFDVKRGTGPEPKPKQTANVNYTGWIWDDGKRGRKFDSSFDRGTPFSFTLNEGQVIPGWDAGVATMHVGGTRFLIIPPRLAYADRGAGDLVPPNATLLFLVELISVG